MRRSSTAIGLQVLGVPEAGGAIYELALTHRSFAFEHADQIGHNERLEFLGDAILGAVVTDLIYNRYPHLPEGAMAPLRASVVNALALADLAREIGLGPHLKLGRGEEASGGRDKSSLLANVTEAVIGAVYVDRGLEAVRAALVPLFTERLDAVVAAGDRFDPKAALQEKAARARRRLPQYRLASEGPDHDKRFTARVYLDDRLLGTGDGRSKKEAEQNAARDALARVPDLGADHAKGDHDARAS